MLIYNTTFQVTVGDAENFVIWLNECYIPTVLEHGLLRQPRLSRVLSHRDDDSECFSLQWEVDSSADLHKWYTEIGVKLNDELSKIFKEKAVGFPTLLEVIL